MFRLTAFTLAAALSAGIASADRLVIDDDNWSIAEDRPALGQTIDVDDDGWSRVDNVAERSDRSATTSGECTQLESSAGLVGEACGVLSREEIMKKIGSAN